MDTPTAIVQLTSLRGQLQNQLDAIDVALANLNGTYVAKLKELDDAQATIIDLQTQISKPMDVQLTNEVAPSSITHDATNP